MQFNQQIYSDALAEGHTDTNIADFLAGKGMGITNDQLREARAEGYTDQQIVGFLVDKISQAPPEPEEEKGIIEEAYDAASNLFRGMGSALTTMPVSAVKGTGTAIFGAPLEGEFVSDLSQTERDIQEWFGGDTDTMSYKLGSAIGSMGAFVATSLAGVLLAPAAAVPAAGAAALTWGARLAPLAAKYAAPALMGAGAGAAEQTDRMRHLGEKLGDVSEIDRRLSLLSGYAVGTSEIASLRWTVGLLLKAIKKDAPKEIVNGYVRWLAAAGAEGAQEAGAQIAQNAIAKGYYDPNISLTESAAENFGYGASAAGILHGVLALALPRGGRGTGTDLVPTEEPAAETAPVDEPILALADQSTPVLLLEDLRPESEKMAAPDEDGATVAQTIVDDLGSDLVLSFNNGAIATDENGTPDAYEVGQDERSRLFVQTKSGLRVSPYLSTRQQAEAVRSELNFKIPEILERQDRVETEALAQESVRTAKEEDRGTLLVAARASMTSPVVRFDELTDNEAVRINSRRVNTRRQPFTEDDFLTVTDLSDQGLGSERIEELLPQTPRVFGEDEKLGLLSSLEEKGFSSEGAGFDRFARRKTGTTDLDAMGNAQLEMLETAIEELPSFPAGELRSLPVIQEPEFNAHQYVTAINTARLMPARPDTNLAEGEILKSDINKSLGIRGGLSESILQEAVKRGDLIKSAKRKNAYTATDKYRRPSEYTIARQVEGGPKGPLRGRVREEDIEGLAPLERGELIEQEARDAAAAQPTAPFVGEGIKIRRAETDGTPASLAEASAAFKAKIDQATVRSDVRDKLQSLGGVDKFLVGLIKRLSNVKGLEASPVALELVSALEGGQLGVFRRENNSAKMAIAVSLDAIRDPKAGKEAAMRDLEQVLDHETIHALKILGLFTDAEWGTLTNYVKKAGTSSNETYYQEAEKDYEKYGLSEEGLVEEAIANAFGDFGRKKTIYVNGKPQKITGKPRNLFDRIVDFFRRLRGAFSDMDIESANQVFTGLREPQTGPAAPAPGVTAVQQARADAAGMARGQRRPDAPAELFAVRRVSRGARPRDLINTIQSALNDDMVVADKALSKRARALSVLDLTYNEELPGKTGAKIGEVAQRLQRRALRILKSPVDIVTDQSKDGLISDALAAEALRALQQSGNAANWYTAKVAEAMEVAAEIHPEILTDPDARFLFMASLAITSQKTPVLNNARYAEEAYRDYQRNGRFSDKGWGDAAPSMRKNFELLNNLIEDHGLSGTRDIFDQSFTVRQLKKMGFPASSAELMDATVNGSYMMGAKIGQGFYQNLIGNYDPLTIDMWLMRTMGRMSGKIIGNPALLAKQTDRLYESLLESGKNFEIDSLVTIMEAESLDEVDIIELADNLRLQHERAFREARQLKQKYVKPEWAKAAQAIVTQQTKPKDSPSSGGFRQASRRIANKVLDKVRASGYPDMTIADLQATLWYPEKSLWEKLGAGGGERLNTDYAQAFRRIRDGIGDERVLAGERGAGRPAGDVLGRDAAAIEESQEVYGEPEAALPEELYAVRRKTASELIDFIKANPDGFTVDIDGTGVPARGYAVAPVKEAEVSIAADELTEGLIDSFLRNLRSLEELGGDTIYMGGWLNEADGKYYLDGVHVYADLDTALYVAGAADQIAIFDLGEFNEINTTEGIASLKEAGTYSSRRYEEFRRTQANTARQFEEGRRAREDDAGRGAEVQYAVRRGGRLGPPVESRAARERRQLDRARAEAPTLEEAKRIRDAQRRGDIQTGDYSQRLQAGAINPIFHSSTPLAWKGKNHRVVIQRGHNEWDDLKQGYNGFGLRHADKHLTDIQANTPFDSVQGFVDGMLSAYRNSRNTPEAANFELRESGDSVVLRWDNPSPKWPYPFTLVFKEASFNRFESLIEAYPNLIDETFFSLTTAFALPAERGAVKPRVLPQVNPGASVTAKRAAAEAKPRERVLLSLREQYSVRRRGRDNEETREQQKYYDRLFDSGPNETFFEKTMRALGLNSEEHIGSRFRYWVVDKFEGWTAAEKKLLKGGFVDKITAESSTSAMFAQFTRASGVISAALTVGPPIYNRGFFHALNESQLSHRDPRIAEEYRKEIEQLTIDTAYRDVVTGEDVSWGGKWGPPMALVPILQEVDNLGLMEQSSAYAGAVRARRLKAEGRERMFSEEDIEIGLELGVRHPEIRLAHQRYQLWNNSIVNLMIKSGVISEQMGELWKSNSDYLPFYREFYADEGVNYQVISAEDGTPTRETLFESLDTKNNKFFPSFQNLKQPKELKGGKPVYRLMVGDVADTRAYIKRDSPELEARLAELIKLNEGTGRRVYITASSQRIRDPLNNMLQNASAAISSSMLNVAVSRGVRDLRMMGDSMARPISEDAAPDDTTGPHPNTLGIRVNGETKWYWVGDRMLIDSLIATNDIDMPFLGLQALPAQLLRELITKDPGFMAANMLRDTLSAWTTSGVNIMPVVGTMRGYGEALMKSSSALALQAGGVYGGYDFKGDTASAAKAFKKHQKEGRRVRMRDAPSRIWRAWDKFAGASDTSTRIAVYNRVLKETGNEAQALTEALEVINFSRKGASAAMRYMTAIIPFLNARVQGLDVLHRGTKGEVTTWDRQARKTRFYWRAATIIALTTGYYLAQAHSDEDENPWYHNAPEYIKDNYWIIPPTWVGMSKEAPAVRIPIPFEVGVVFKVIPERILRLIDGSSDGRETWDAILRHGGTTLNFNPTPQWALPVLEGVVNYSFYRDRPVVGYWEGKNESWVGADPTFTSPFAIMLSEAVDKAGGRLSAQKVDHIFRGYVGTLGSYALMAADAVGRVAAGLPEREARRLDEWPVLGRFLQENQGRGPVQTFYDLYHELDLFVGTLNNLRDAGDVEREDYLIRSRANLEANAGRIKELKGQLDEMRLFRKQIKQDGSATPSQKRKALDDIDRMSNEIVRGVRKLRTQSLARP